MQNRPPIFQKCALSLHIVIVGAGLSGLAAAIGLRQIGHKVTVLEQNFELREIGAGIQLPANSSRILNDLGILEKVKEYAVQPENLLIRSYRRKQLYTQDLNRSIQQRFRFPHLLIHRADLRRILYNEAQIQGAFIHLNSCVESVDFDSPKVTLSTGKQFTADLIFGADGEHSICRRLLLGNAHVPISSGDIVYRIAVPASKVAAEPSVAHLVNIPSVHAWYGPDSHAVCYQLLKDGIFNIVLTLPESKGSVILGPQPGDLDFVRNRCKDWDPDFQHLLNLADTTLKWTLLETEELKTWVHSSGRFALLGDSAHAILPYLAQGAAISLESAHTLTTLLQHISHRSQLPGILFLYEKIRVPRARSIKRRSKHMHDVCQLADGSAQRERDTILLKNEPTDGFPNPWADPGYQEWMWAFDARAEAERMWEKYSDEKRPGAANLAQRRKSSKL